MGLYTTTLTLAAGAVNLGTIRLESTGSSVGDSNLVVASGATCNQLNVTDGVQTLLSKIDQITDQVLLVSRDADSTIQKIGPLVNHADATVDASPRGAWLVGA